MFTCGLVLAIHVTYPSVDIVTFCGFACCTAKGCRFQSVCVVEVMVDVSHFDRTSSCDPALKCGETHLD